MTSPLRPLGLSAFVRCKNEEEYIVASLLSAYRAFDEIVVILNNSTDRTRELVEDLMTDHPKIRLTEYTQECAPAGPGYSAVVAQHPERSLARYYNWCLEQTTFSHVCKWDGDMIAVPTLDGVRDLLASHDVITIGGWDVLDQPTVSYESRIFRYDPAHTRYEDWELYEVLKYEYPRSERYEPKCYLHMKLVKREWLHRQWTSPNDHATQPFPEPGRGSAAAPPSIAAKLERNFRGAARYVRDLLRRATR
ncbi:MAG TPA: glycosyltransferase family 2 protein [Thermoanaerobaculia bacterium]|nr:glycosyltransferase family 2 protein [Thermoanaerobaculia bacterium]